MRNRGLADVGHTAHIDIQAEIPFLVGECQEIRAAYTNTGIIDHDIELAMLLDYVVNQRIDLLAISDVAGDTIILLQTHRATEITRYHSGSLALHGHSDRMTYALRVSGSSDDGDFTR